MTSTNAQNIIGILTLVCLGLFISCNSPKNNSRNFLNDAIEKNPLGFLYQSDTLTLMANFSECGEFGGHKEMINIFCNHKREYFANYTVDSIDLNCPDRFEDNAIIVNDTLFKLTMEDEYVIIEYLDKLYKRGLISKYPSSSNDYFNAHTKYSGLNLTTYEPDEDWFEFEKLTHQLIK
jgi:hypothetical protein